MARLPEPIEERRRALGRALAEYRRKTGINQTELGRRTGYTRSSIAHIEKARQFPVRKFWEAADRVYQADGALVAEYDKVTAAETHWRQLEHLHRDQLTRQFTRHGRALPEAGEPEDDDVNRRTLLTLLGPAALGGPILDTLEQLRRSLDGALALEPAERDADEWEQLAADYARHVHVQPPARTLPALTADFADLHDRIATASGPLRTRMIHSAAQLAALTAITFVTVRDTLTAQRWWRTAARAAATVGDPRLSALISGRHAVLSLYSAAPERVLAMADRAIALGTSKPCAGVIMGWSARAQTLARLGHDEAARQALDTITDLYPRLPDSDNHDKTSQWTWTDQRLHFIESEVHSFAGRINLAFRAQDAARALYPATSFQGPTQIEAHRATVLIRSGHVETGVTHLASTLDALTDWQRADGLVHRTATDAVNAVPADQQHKPYVTRARALFAPAPT